MYKSEVCIYSTGQKLKHLLIQVLLSPLYLPLLLVNNVKKNHPNDETHAEPCSTQTCV